MNYFRVNPRDHGYKSVERDLKENKFKLIK
jgi:hypothetical protein